MAILSLTWLFCVLVATLTAPAQARDVRIYDQQYNLRYRIEGGKIYDNRLRQVGRIDDNRIYDQRGRQVGRLDDRRDRPGRRDRR